MHAEPGRGVVSQSVRRLQLDGLGWTVASCVRSEVDDRVMSCHILARQDAPNAKSPDTATLISRRTGKEMLRGPVQ